jgi:hypothetical protein
MKKSFLQKIMMAWLFAACCDCCFAQVFVGGSIGFERSGGSSKTGNVSTEQPTSVGFNVSPMAGYSLNSRWSVATRLNLAWASVNDRAVVPAKTRTFNWAVTPFARYTMVRFGKFAFVAEGGVALGGAKERLTTDGSTRDGAKAFTCGVYIVPLITFKASDHVILGMGSNLMNFGWDMAVSKTGDRKDVSHSVGLGVNANDLFGVLGDLQAGVLYKF